MTRELDPNALESYQPFQGPIPGQSLTNSEDSRQPWEQPPQVTKINEARDLMFLEILKEENLETVVTLMNHGLSISKLTEMLLFIAYTKGVFNADMMMLVAEPTMYMLLAIAEQVGIDPKIDEDDDITTAEDLDPEDEQDIDRLTEQFQELTKNPTQRRKLEELQDNIAKTEIPQEIKARLAEVNFAPIRESLLQKPEARDTSSTSLLERK